MSHIQGMFFITPCWVSDKMLSAEKAKSPRIVMRKVKAKEEMARVSVGLVEKNQPLSGYA
jgi:hypothetical protein